MLKIVKDSVLKVSRSFGYDIVPLREMKERDLALHLRQLLRRLAVDCVLDVGANIGQYRDFLRDKVLYDGPIVSFEPVGRHIEALRERSRSDRNWHIEGYALGNVDSVDITIRGIGGHGAWPHKTKDPIVLAAQTVLALQTIVSREIAPGEPAVVTVGSIHGGTKHNIIPDEVQLQLTLRSYTDEVRVQTIAAIKRMTRGLAEAAGLPEDRLPIVALQEQEFTPATYNDPALTRRLAGAFKNWFSETNVQQVKPVMGGEDFSEYGRTADKIPICMFWLGAVKPELVQESEKSGKPLPSLHSSQFAPLPEPTIGTGVIAMTAAVLELAEKPR